MSSQSGFLVLSRHIGESIHIGEHLVLTLVSVQHRGSVTLQIGKGRHELAVGYTADIEPGVSVKLIALRAGQARFGITAPKSIPVHRGEIYARIKAQELEEQRRQRMPERVGKVIAGVFLALSTWPAYLLQMAVMS